LPGPDGIGTRNDDSQRRHCEERSDEAISSLKGKANEIASPAARND